MSGGESGIAIRMVAKLTLILSAFLLNSAYKVVSYVQCILKCRSEAGLSLKRSGTVSRSHAISGEGVSSA